VPPPNPAQQPLRLVWWVLWGAFQIGIFVIYRFMAMPHTSDHVNEPAYWQLAFLPALISGAVRWTLLPAMKNPEKGLPCFIFGVAMAETTCFLGIFIFPSHQFPLFIASVFGIFQFVPVYYGSYFGSNDEG
jgi:hypothetical protein